MIQPVGTKMAIPCICNMKVIPKKTVQTTLTFGCQNNRKTIVKKQSKITQKDLCLYINKLALSMTCNTAETHVSDTKDDVDLSWTSEYTNKD